MHRKGCSRVLRTLGCLARVHRSQATGSQRFRRTTRAWPLTIAHIRGNALAAATAWQNEPGAKVGPRLSSMHTSTGDTSM